MTRLCIGLFRSPAGLGSYSMDRYATSLRSTLENLNDLEFGVTEVVPPFGARSSKTGSTGRLRRFELVYPRYLRYTRSTRFAVSHVLDHAYGHLVYALDRRRSVVTCHDILPVQQWRGTIPGLSRRTTRPVTLELSLSGLRRAAAVIVASNSTRQDLVDVVGVDDERIFVIPYGVGTSFRPSKRRDGAPRVLSVSTGGHYKNRAGTLAVMTRVMAALGDVELVCIGSLSSDERELARRYGIENRVIDLGVVPEAELRHAYASSDVLLFPSHYEGFGWPVVEAMASGVPVVTSTWRSLVEVGGGATLTADANDHDELAERVLRVLTDADVARSLRERGLRRAQEFRWEKTARQTLGVYRRVLEEIGAP